jgi:hypothetical protein
MQKRNKQTKKRLALDTQAIRNLQSDEIKLAAGGFISNSGPSIGYYEPTCGGGWGG